MTGLNCDSGMGCGAFSFVRPTCQFSVFFARVLPLMVTAAELQSIKFHLQSHGPFASSPPVEDAHGASGESLTPASQTLDNTLQKLNKLVKIRMV